MLRLVHLLGGIFWVGSGPFTNLFLVPALASTGPAAGQVFAALQRRRLFVVLPVVALLTIAWGVRLMWITSVGFSPAYLASASGRTFVAGAVAAIAAFVLSVAVVRPAAVRAARIGASSAAATEAERVGLAAELARIQRRGALFNLVVFAPLVLAAVSMAVGRYVH